VNRGSHLASLLAALGVLLLAGCGGGANDGRTSTVAEVNGTSITRATLAHWAAVVENVPRGEQAASVTGQAAKAILRRLIELQWTVGEAAEQHVAVGAGEARRTLALLDHARLEGTSGSIAALGKAEEEELQQLLVSLGVSSADRLWLVKVALLQSKLRVRLQRQAEREITGREIAAYYHSHASRFAVPEKRDIEIFITLKRASAAQGRREVEAGQSVRQVAKRRNESGEAHGGLIMGLARGAGEPPFEEYVFGAGPGVLLGPVKQALYYVFRVTKAIQAHERTLREVEASIRRGLGARRVSQALTPALERRWRARTSCRVGYAVDSCDY
jgi:PPIC-type PPIASE domain